MKALLLTLICLALPFSALAEDSSATPTKTSIASSIPLAIDQDKFYLSCEFDSFKTTCLLDSGSTFSTVNSPLFDHYPIWGHIKYNSGTGKEIDADKIYVHKLKLANHALKGWPVARLSHLATSQNIMGLDVFLRAPVLFDFKNHTLTFNPPTPEKLSLSPLVLEYSLLLLPVKIGSQNLYAVWDTGASTCIIDKDYIEKHPDEFTYLKKISGTDAAHTDMPMELYLINHLEIGGLSLKNVPVAAMDLSGMRKVHPHFPVFFLGFNLMINHLWYFNIPASEWGVY